MPAETAKSQRIACASPACRRTDPGIITKRPHSFQIVKISHFGTENMDDDVVRIDQHPVGRWKPFDSNALAKSLLDLVGKLNGHGRDLTGRATGRNDHVIGDIRFARERDRHDLLRLVVVQRLKNEPMEVFDVERSAAGRAGGLSGTFGQEVSWSMMAGRNAAPERAGAIGDASWVDQREWPSRMSD